ncbi:MAG: glycosyltransferase family 4 protein [Vicinamibacterales bacterium]
MSRPRLAWFSPLPPVRSGISAYSADILPRLEPWFTIETFVDVEPSERGRILTPLESRAVPGTAGAWSAHAFVSKHALQPYDLIVYQLGNAACHDYMWPYLLRYPGLVVLHDAALHHARAAALLGRGDRNAYRAEFAHAHPGAPVDVAEFAVAGLSGAPYYLWPLRRIAMEAARLVAVHAEPVARQLSTECPTTGVRTITMGVPEIGPAPSASSGPILACFGRVTPEKRIEQVLRAFATVAGRFPSARLVLVGEVADYFDLGALIANVALQGRVEVTGYVADDELSGSIAAADICVCLRWPTARETSASWLRCLAAGKPTVMTDLLQTSDVPVLDPRTWALAHRRTDARSVDTPPGASEAVAIAIDILDEDHSLALALDRLMSDAALRDRLGRRAKRWWHDHHTLEHMTSTYRDVIGEAMQTAPPPRHADWPPHLLADGQETLRAILAECSVESIDRRDSLFLDGRGTAR